MGHPATQSSRALAVSTACSSQGIPDPDTTASVLPSQACIDSYIQLMEAGNCTAPTPLFIASGLLTYMNASGEGCLIQLVSSRRCLLFCTRVLLVACMSVIGEGA